MDVLQQLLRQPRPLLKAEAVPRVLDLLWSRLGGLNGKFFEAGWGNLGIVNLQEDLEIIKQWPPQDMQVRYTGLQSIFMLTWYASVGHQGWVCAGDVAMSATAVAGGCSHHRFY